MHVVSWKRVQFEMNSGSLNVAFVVMNTEYAANEIMSFKTTCEHNNALSGLPLFYAKKKTKWPKTSMNYIKLALFYVYEKIEKKKLSQN